MSKPALNPVLAELRERIGQLEGGEARAKSVLPFAVPKMDQALSGGGLAFGALHEVAGGAGGTVDGAAAALFVAGIAARTKGRVLWCMTRQDLFFPAVSQVHVHAMIAARDDVGEALRLTKPELYEWRERFAAKAREQGIAMVATRRADVAATRPYSQGRPVPMSAARPILVISRRRP